MLHPAAHHDIFYQYFLHSDHSQACLQIMASSVMKAYVTQCFRTLFQNVPEMSHTCLGDWEGTSKFHGQI